MNDQKRIQSALALGNEADQEWFCKWMEKHGEAIQHAGWNQPSVFKVEELLRELFADTVKG